MKTYTKPSLEAIELQVKKDIVAASFNIGSGTFLDDDAEGGWTRRGGGWNSNDWSDLDQEVED